MEKAGNRAHPTWLTRVVGTDGPIYLAIADAIAAAVAVDELSQGERLPTQRALADALNVDLTTVSRAYAEARRRGLLEATVGRGTFVRSRAEGRAGEVKGHGGSVDLSMNMPPPIEAPSVSDLICKGVAELFGSHAASDLLTYRSGAGTHAERRAGAIWLQPTLGEVEPDRLVISAGAQPAFLAILTGVADTGDVVLVDTHTYPGFRLAAKELGVRLVAVEADAQGIIPEAVSDACRRTPRPKALYCVPTIHNPTTVTMPLTRRRAIAETARQYGLVVIEDDAYGRLPSVPVPAIAALAPDISFHVATVSKTLSPALRVAFVAAPDLRRGGRLSAALRANVLMPSPLLTGLATSWIQDGTADTLVHAIRRETVARQQIASRLLPEGSFDAHPEGMHLWLRLPEHWDRLSFITHLQRQNALAVVPSDAFAIAAGDRTTAPSTCEAVRISLGAAANRDQLRSALRAVADALQNGASSQYSEVV